MSITSYSLNEDCRIKFVDGTATTPFEMEIFGVEPGTEIAPGVRNTPQRRIVHRGNTFAGYKRDLDEVPEVTMEFTAKVFDDDFKGTGVSAKNAIEQFFNPAARKGWNESGTSWDNLASTNKTGNYASLVKSDVFTYEMQILWDNGIEDKAMGYQFKWVEVVDFKWMNNDDLQFTLTLRNLTRDTETVNITAFA